jgi:hypothetical protein
MFGYSRGEFQAVVPRHAKRTPCQRTQNKAYLAAKRPNDRPGAAAAWFREKSSLNCGTIRTFDRKRKACAD